MRLPPGPINLPLSGILRQVRLLPFLESLAARYGDLAHFRVGRLHYFLVNEPELVRQVLVTDAGRMTKGPALRNARITLGEGLLTSDGELHRRQRRLIQPVFHPRRVATYGPLFCAYGQRRAEGWREGQVLELHAEMTALTLEIVTRTLFGSDLPAGTGDIGSSMQTLVTMFDRARNPLAPLLNRLPLPSNIRFLKALRHAESTLEQLVALKRQQLATAPGGGGQGAPDLLTLLLGAHAAAGGEDGGADDNPMSDKQLRDEAITLFTAGHETTANALVFTFYLLAQHVEVLARVEAEADRVLCGTKPAEVEQLPYCRAVVAESMRLYPPAWIVARQTPEEYELGGYRCPAGSVLLMSQFLLHRDKRFWPEPLRFDPGRFTDEAARNSRPRFAYFPFGSGPRSCIGEPFAWTEAVLLLATLSRKWRLGLLPGQTLRLHPTITLRPRDPLLVRVLPRR